MEHNSMKPPKMIFTKHMRVRFCERVLVLSKKVDLEDYENKNRKSLNFELKKRVSGCAVIEEHEVSSMLKDFIKKKHGDHTLRFYLGGKVIYVATMQKDPYDNDEIKPFFVTCYKKDGSVGEYYLKELYSRPDVLRKTL